MWRRGLRVVAGVLAVLLLALLVNDLVARRETAPARADLGRLVSVPGGQLQVREDSFVQDNRRMTYSSYNESASSSGDFVKAEPLDSRLKKIGRPLLVLFGTEEQIEKPGAWRPYRQVPGAQVRLIPGAGHSPMWERPVPTARHILNFDRGLRPPAATG